MVFQEKFILNSYTGTYFSSQIDLIISGLRDENEIDLRCGYIRKTLNDFNGNVILFQTDEKAEILRYEIRDRADAIIDKQSNLNLIPGLRKFLKLNKVE